MTAAFTALHHAEIGHVPYSASDAPRRWLEPAYLVSLAFVIVVQLLSRSRPQVHPVAGVKNTVGQGAQFDTCVTFVGLDDGSDDFAVRG